MIVLASASPRRAELMRRVGLEFEVQATSVDETPPPEADATTAAVVIARRKAAAVGPTDRFVVAADTLGEIEGEILGKPRNAGHAQAMLERLQGRTHRVVTGVVVRTPAGRFHEASASTLVTFGPLTKERIQAYVATGAPLDKACGYGIQGEARAFVERIEGDFSNVVGLPMRTLLRLLGEAGYPLPPDLQVS
jgi:septum formation protein